ncbi:MAG: DUF4199 domain-containing protein [Bacteroidia bacterium]|nr:DUF4199 domain-containing protein [Bacteroidia bacterium]
MKSTVKRYGLYSALTLIVLFALAWIIGAGSDYGTQETIGYISIVVALSFVFFGIKHFRDAVNGGNVSFGMALKIGVLISLFASVAFGFLDIVYKLINPEFTTEYYDTMVEQVKTTVPAEQLDAKLAEMESQRELFSNPILSFLLMAFTVFIIGFIISLLSSLVLQRKKVSS